MERHKCKLCPRDFANGRALGGHMRYHLAKLPIPPKTHQQNQGKLGDRTESASSLSSFSGDEERESEEKALVYGLRENPKRSFRLVDPEFFDAGPVVIVQDRESETERVSSTESRKNPTRQRSKRTWKMGMAEDQALNKPKLRKPSSTESVAELEQVSSVSDTSPEQDVAMCLMMLSRDTWSSSDDSNELNPSKTQRKKYQCETCNKVFRSFQALGGHKTSHSKVKSCIVDQKLTELTQKIHECPICYRVFGSGQALGGHKRSHFLASSVAAADQNSAKSGDNLAEMNSDKLGENLIDLNLPAPMEDDQDFSQVEVSAVSDPEFIHPIKYRHDSKPLI